MKFRYVFVLLLALLIYSVPITYIIFLSEKETEKYELDINFDTAEANCSKIYQVKRENVKEYYECDATVVCIEKKYISVPDTYKVLVEQDDEVFKNTILATDGTNDIKAGFNGLISGMDYADESIVISYNDFADTVFEFSIPEDNIATFSTDTLYNENNRKMSVIRKSNINNGGFYQVYLSIPKGESYDYGTTISKYKIYTGITFNKTLVLNESCIYKNNDGYYVKKVDEDGQYISDIPVELGYKGDGYVCVSGVDEGTFCDGDNELEQNEEEANEEYSEEDDYIE